MQLDFARLHPLFCRMLASDAFWMFASDGVWPVKFRVKAPAPCTAWFCPSRAPVIAPARLEAPGVPGCSAAFAVVCPGVGVAKAGL